MIVSANIVAHLSIRLPNGEVLTRDVGLNSAFSFDQVFAAAHATNVGPDPACHGSDIWNAASRLYKAEIELREQAEQRRLSSGCS